MAAPQASSRLEMLQARFQQRQLLEKEQKLLQLYDQQQLRAHQVAQRGSAGSNGSNSSGNGTTSTVSHHQTVTRTTTNTHSNANSQPGGKVRQMFDERRQTTVKGIDKSYPLEPLDNRSRKQQSTTTTTTSNVVVSSTSPMKNGNPMSNRPTVVVRRTMRSEANSNVNGGKPIVTYREEVSREIDDDPSNGENDHEQFGDDEDSESRYGNGNRQVDRHTEVQIEDVTNDNSTQRHRTTANIHLSDIDGGNEANRFDDNLGKVDFSTTTKKPLQTDARLERCKNSNVKRATQTSNKHVAGNTTSYTKKRTETSVNSGSTSRASGSTRPTDDERSTRGRSTTPEVESLEIPRSPRPNERFRKSTTPIVDRDPIVAKTCGITKVSQLTHKNSLDFYPRRKSEFEKSKTFRKLQLELGESSPEPAEPNDEDATIYCPRPNKVRSTILNENIYKSERRSSSPIGDRDVRAERRGGRDESPEYARLPVHERRTSRSKEETKLSNFQSQTFSSRRRSSSVSPMGDRDPSEGRRNSRDESPKSSRPSRDLGSPIGERRASRSKEETKLSNFQSQTFSSRRRSSSVSPMGDRDPSEDRRNSRDESPKSSRPSRDFGSPVGERRASGSKDETRTSSFQSQTHSSNERRSSSSSVTNDSFKQRRTSRNTPEPSRTTNPSDSPIYERKSTIKTRETTKTIDGNRHRSINSETSDFHCSRRHSSSSPSRTISHDVKERGNNREASENPIHRRKSNNEEIQTTSSQVKTKNRESNVISSGIRSSSVSPIGPRDHEAGRRCSREYSPERPQSRRGSQSPSSKLRSREASDAASTNRHQIHSTTTTTKRSTSPMCDKSASNRSMSPHGDLRRSSKDRESDRIDVTNRPTSGETLRSIELVKKFARPGTTDEKRTSTERPCSNERTKLEDVEFRRADLRKRSQSPIHRIVKKDKVVLDVSKECKLQVKEDSEKINNESVGRRVRSRSRTASPSSPTSRTMKETASFRAKKTERKNSTEITKMNDGKRQHLEDKKIRDIDGTNLSHGKAKHCDPTIANENRKDRSRGSSAEITLKRQETYKISKPGEKIVTIKRKSSIDDDDDKSAIGKIIVSDTTDKNKFFDRIEKIRTTLSMSGKSEKNVSDPKDFERTDSVESALKRFDSIGVETEHHVTVGIDETDRSSRDSSPEVIRPMSKQHVVDKRTIVKKSVEARSKPTEITVAVVKPQSRKIVTKTRDISKDKNSRFDVVRKIAETTKSVRQKKEKTILPTDSRRSSKIRSNRKSGTSIVQCSKLRGRESSGRGEEKSMERSPECKRRLFDDSDTEIDTDNSRSTIVMSTITTVTRMPETIDANRPNNRQTVIIGDDNMTRSVSSLRDAKSDHEQPTKILRSIEDIRQSIKRESQDFKRELNIFNTEMRKNEESSLSVTTDDGVTSGIASSVVITKTLKPDDVDAIVKIERSIVKLPIARRVAKSPSPDIGVKRSTNGRARTPTGSVRRSVVSSSGKNSDSSNRYGSAESKSPGLKLSSRTSTSPSITREDRMRSEFSKTTERTIINDDTDNNSELTVTEIVTSSTTDPNDGTVIEFDDDDVISENNEMALPNSAKLLPRKQSIEKLPTFHKQQRSSSTTPISRPASALSTSSTGSARGHTSQINLKSKMSTKTKIATSNPQKGPPANARTNNAVAADDGLAPCKICGRRFNSDRVSRHEQICSKTANKKRKQFDATVHRVMGTELEPFVVKKGGPKKAQTDRKASKPEVKSNWRRKHEDFINAIRSAKQVQAHLAAGGKLSDLPPPPASDTSDYIQCPHCGRKFNQSAADRHIPKCQNMMHNKPNPRAPPKPKR